ncbi:MAG TPA: cation:proton antiporter [Candidatus Enterococcus avicola]|uniref:Cation:proton antiporter n=1 Tax=Candidatus Enterococcus avicola TaxID=2838561 RepID=A0A9D2JHS3_9ENTE|nr:cation:proton antiporter [Candidatus Enterococcus avicola]
MLLSIALIFLLGMSFGKIFQKFGLPPLLGMLLTGILLGPYMFNLLDTTILSISAELRQMALIIILVRAGLNLDIYDLKKVGRPAMLMCFVPACFEILGILLLGPKLLGLSLLDAAILGTVIAAVSPAVIVPRMLKLMEEGYGTNKSIPQMILAGASVDDVFVIVLFTAFTGLAQGGTIDMSQLVNIPIAIILGILVGIVVGLGLSQLFTKFHMRDTSKVILILSIAFLLVTLESWLEGVIGFSGLLAVMALGATIHQLKVDVAARLSLKFSKMWSGAEVLLFVLVGALINVDYAINAGLVAIMIVLGSLIFRIIGVYISLLKTNLNSKEKIFTAIAYTPKATVQAAIGGIPLAMGLASGEIVLTVAVISIVVTAPLGAILIDKTYHKLLVKD